MRLSKARLVSVVVALVAVAGVAAAYAYTLYMSQDHYAPGVGRIRFIFSRPAAHPVDHPLIARRDGRDSRVGIKAESPREARVGAQRRALILASTQLSSRVSPDATCER